MGRARDARLREVAVPDSHQRTKPKTRAPFPSRRTIASSTLLGLVALLTQGGCATPAQTALLIGAGVGATTATLAQAPGEEMEQIYYLGCFDPQEQIPPT